MVAHSQGRGAEVAAIDLAAELDARGHHDRLVALRPAFDGGVHPDLPVLGSGDREAWPGGVLGRARALRRLVRSEAPDVVVAHGGEIAQLLALTSWGRRPVVVWQRILDFPASVWRPGRRTWWRLVAGRVDGIVALTDHMAGELDRLRVRGLRWVIPNSRRPERFAGVDRASAAAALRTELGLGPDAVLVGLVGQLVAQKRPDRAVEVLAAVRSQDPSVHLVVAGTGPMRATLENQVAGSGLEGAVSFLGHRDDVEQVLGGVDLLLLTSDTEGIPGIVIEAAMTGCPVVTVPVGGVAEVVLDGVTGIVTPSAEVAAIAGSVLVLVRGPERRRALGEAARVRSAELSTAVAAARYETAFTELLDRRPRC